MTWWRIWEPKHTFADTVPKILGGLRVGSITLDEPFADDESDDGVVFEIDVPSNTPDDQLLTMLTKLVAAADQDHRANGGQGLRLATIDVKQQQPAKQATVSLATMMLDDDVKSLDAVIEHFRDKPMQYVNNLVVKTKIVRTHSTQTAS